MRLILIAVLLLVVVGVLAFVFGRFIGRRSGGPRS
jgi:hypothetical protein